MEVCATRIAILGLASGELSGLCEGERDERKVSPRLKKGYHTVKSPGIDATTSLPT